MYILNMMPIRKEPLITGEYYHVFNKTYQYEPFIDQQLSKRAQLSLWYANYPHDISISKYLHASKELQQNCQDKMSKFHSKNTILAYVFMSNHFHILLRQDEDNGISKYVADFQNTITQYFNTKHDNQGPIFHQQFKAVRINTGEQLLHVSRYIHLNPHTANITKNCEELQEYEFSSLGIYAQKYLPPHKIVNTDILLSYFNNNPSKYLEFVNDNAANQRSRYYLSKQYIDT